MERVRVMRLWPVPGIVTLLSCGGRTDVAQPSPGEFRLVAVDGVAVPGALLGDAEVLAGSLGFGSGGACIRR
jgi:hypothetical protein